MKLWCDGWTEDDWKRWHAKFEDALEPSGCLACGAISGCCDKYPSCPGNPEWKPEHPTVTGDA